MYVVRLEGTRLGGAGSILIVAADRVAAAVEPAVVVTAISDDDRPGTRTVGLFVVGQ